MELNYQVESLEGLDEGVAKLYAEKDGKYTLNVKGAVPESALQALRQEAVDAKTEAQRRRKTVERITGKLGLENADGLDDALEALIAGQGKGKDDEAQKAVIEQLKAAAKAREDELTGQISAIRLDGSKARLKSELMGQGYAEAVADMIANANMNRVQVDESGSTRILTKDNTPLAGSGADGFATEADLAKELAAAMPDLLTDKGKGGGGKPPASQGKPTQKTIPRSQFDNMSQSERVDFSKSGGKVVDG